MADNEKHWLQRFVEKNIWSLMILIIGGAIVSNQVKVNAQDIKDINDKIDKTQALIERVIVLEEHDKSKDATLQTIGDDLKEVKSDVKVLLKQTR
jgi:hypothetical protein